MTSPKSAIIVRCDVKTRLGETVPDSSHSICEVNKLKLNSFSSTFEYQCTEFTTVFLKKSLLFGTPKGLGRVS